MQGTVSKLSAAERQLLEEPTVFLPSKRLSCWEEGRNLAVGCGARAALLCKADLTNPAADLLTFQLALPSTPSY